MKSIEVSLMHGARLIIVLTIVLIRFTGVIAQTTYPVEFALKAPVGTQSVHVAGDFNNWSQTSNPMIYSHAENLWKTTIPLFPGVYQYRFFINGINWIKDPSNPVWGGEKSNSILRVKSPIDPILKNINPETGSVITKNSIEINAEYWDGIQKNNLDRIATKITIDNIPQQFEYLAAKRLIRCYSSKLKEGEHLIRIEAADNAGNQTDPLNSIINVNAHNSPPEVDAGCTIIAGVNERIFLNSGLYHDPDTDPIRSYQWRLRSRPAGSKTKLQDSKTAFPSFVPDEVGRYVFELKLNDGDVFSKDDSVDVYTFVKRTYPTEFSFADSSFKKVYESPVDSVYLAGEFNQWSVVACKMNDYDKDGVWTAWVDLSPGEYEYKFVVNNQYWIPEPENPYKVADGWQGFNSVKKVTLNLAPVIKVRGLFQPGTILLDASESHSKVGKRLIFNWYQDINNPQRFPINGAEKLTIPIPQKDGTYYYYIVASDDFGSSTQETIYLKVKDRKVRIHNFSASPLWASDAIVYEIFVKQFTPEGNLQGVISKIPYLKSLGINCIWLMPIFESPTEHGYGPSDFYRLLPAYGTMDDLKTLITIAHEAGIKVMLDFVANHTSDQHPYFVSAFQNPFSLYRDFYQWYSPDDDVYLYQYKFHNDWDRLPNLNFDNPQVRKYVLDIAAFWAYIGADGYRCDVAWGVPHDFWKLFRRHVKNINPDFLLLNETLPRSPQYHEDEFDMSYDTDFYGSLLDVVAGRKPISAIEYGLNKTSLNYPPYTLNLRYMENHDMERFIHHHGLYKTKLAATLLFTIPGTPMILYGQELGFHEKLPPMEWSKTGTAMYEFYQKLITLRRKYAAFRTNEMINVTTNHNENVYAYIRRNNDDVFLIILNFAPDKLECQLLLPNFLSNVKNMYFQDMLTGVRQNIKTLAADKISIIIEPETSHVLKINGLYF